MLTRGLITITGKGGVGKSAVAAAIASLLAGSGLSVVLLETDPRQSIHRLLDSLAAAPGDGSAGA
jgi:arsenite-transporting ATPase